MHRHELKVNYDFTKIFGSIVFSSIYRIKKFM